MKKWRARKVLGVRREATPAEVRRKYRREVFGLHPDRGGNDVARMTQLREACDAILREEGIRGAQERATADLRTALANLPADRIEVAQLRLTAEQRAAGGVFRLVARLTTPCPECQGEGTAPGKVAPECGACGGQGARLAAENMVRACRLCDGRGRANTLDTMCHPCSGTGDAAIDETFECLVPAGMPVGGLLRVARTHRGALQIRLGEA